MLSTIAFIFATSMIMAVRSQTWTGTFTADSTCSTSACCCLSGQIVITHPSTSILAFTSGLNGQCNGATTLSTTTAYPSGSVGYITEGNQTLTCTLSSDSNTITAVNSANSACDGNAYRSAAIKHFDNTMAILATLFIGLTKITFNI